MKFRIVVLFLHYLWHYTLCEKEIINAIVIVFIDYEFEKIYMLILPKNRLLIIILLHLKISY